MGVAIKVAGVKQPSGGDNQEKTGGSGLVLWGVTYVFRLFVALFIRSKPWLGCVHLGRDWLPLAGIVGIGGRCARQVRILGVR